MTIQLSLNTGLVSMPVRAEVHRIFTEHGEPNTFHGGLAFLYTTPLPSEGDRPDYVRDQLSTVHLFAIQRQGRAWRREPVREFLAEVWQKHALPGEPRPEWALKSSWQRGAYFSNRAYRPGSGIVILSPQRMLDRHWQARDRGRLIRHIRALETMEV